MWKKLLSCGFTAVLFTFLFIVLYLHTQVNIFLNIPIKPTLWRINPTIFIKVSLSLEELCFGIQLCVNLANALNSAHSPSKVDSNTVTLSLYLFPTSDLILRAIYLALYISNLHAFHTASGC